MKNAVLFATLTVLMISFLGISNAQDEIQPCMSTMEWHVQKQENDPNYRKHVEDHRAYIASWQSEDRSPDCSAGPLIVPIAFHFDSGTNMPTTAAEQACAITLVQEMVDELNIDFAGLDPDAANFNANFGSCFGTTVGASCIEFCLASQNHPAGFGLSNGDPAVTFGTADFSYPTTLGLPGGTPVNGAWAGYFNVYITDLGSSGVLGISNGIPGNFNGDGVMLTACQFGGPNVVCAGFDHTNSCGAPTGNTQGETLAHEAGHFFGLFHIWGDELLCSFLPTSPNQCSGSDMISDTPNMSCSYSGYNSCGSHSSCADLPSTCGSEDMYMNFMAYSEDVCWYMFTSEQADVMYATATQQGYSTTSPAVCNPMGCPPDYAGANAIATPHTTGSQDYETDGQIESTQNIINGLVDYDSAVEICLQPGFVVETPATFNAFIDGCNGTGGVINPLQDETIEE